MMLAQVGALEIVMVVVYLLVVGYLGWLGFRHTKTSADYLVAGRGVHPFIMALSYGATFISTSAIVGFGGVAGMFGMSLLWLTVLNIFVGIFIAFVFLGGPTRRIGHKLGAHTFPELLGRRFNSKFIQVFAGLVVFIFIPLYAAAVLSGGCAFIAKQFGMPYETALLVFSILIAGYVVMGGLKGVMYTDALQGSIMFIGMIVLLVVTYDKLGGVTAAHEGLAKLAAEKNLFAGIGFNGWTSMPEFGWGEPQYNLWWIVVSAIILGVGIGVLAQPQLAVRFMTVKSKRELNRAVLIGGVFILVMTGVAFTGGSLSNLWFHEHEKIKGTQIGELEPVMVIAKKCNNADYTKEFPCLLIHIDTDNDKLADTHLIYGPQAKHMNVGKLAFVPRAEIKNLPDGEIEISPKANSYMRAVVRKKGEWMLSTGAIIPTFVKSAMPKWFGLVFLLTLLAAAMSTLSSQFHAVGTSIGRDVYEQLTGKNKNSIGVTRIGIIIGIVIAVLISYYATGAFFIARATAIFFGLCAAAFLPTYVGGLFFKGMTKPAAIASMITGFLCSGFWLMFIKAKEADGIGVIYWFTNKISLVDNPSLQEMDSVIVALPASIIVAILVSFITKAPAKEHLDKCFEA